MSGSEHEAKNVVAGEALMGYPSKPDQMTKLLQPHGVLLVVAEPNLKILQISENVSAYFNVPAADWLGQSLIDFLDSTSLNLFQQQIQTNDRYIYALRLQKPTQLVVDCRVHHQNSLIILELERAANPTTAVQWIGQAHSAMARIRPIRQVEAFLQAAVSEIRSLTGFDRVMVYRFDDHADGEVIAEAKRPDLPTYLGLHYPATDIPALPRQLYAQGLLRYLPDLTARGVELLTDHRLMDHTALASADQDATGNEILLNEATPEQDAPSLPAIGLPAIGLPVIDLRFIMLRGTDPCCVAYHQNMGVAALLVLALVQDQQLWGLISCHHGSPKEIPMPIRALCELLSQLIAAELVHKISDEELEAVRRLKSLQSEFVESIAQATDLRSALIYPAPRILDLVNATGAAICLDDEISLVGATPPIDAISSLIQWAEPQIVNSLFHTHQLPKQYEAAVALRSVATGVLLLRISQLRRYYIVWFRPEVLQTITWAGDPTSLAEPEGAVPLSPRHSFAQWQETVQFTAPAWQSIELDNALDLRNAIVGIVLNRADELTRINRELERSNRELESFAYAASHDLKEPLRGIHNYATFLIEDYAEVLDEAGLDRLQTLINLTQRMEALIDVLMKFSQLGQSALHQQAIDLNELFEQVITLFRMSHPESKLEVRCPQSLPIIHGDPMLLSEVFSNLLSNADKYNDKDNPWVEIGTIEPENLPQGLPQTVSTQLETLAIAAVVYIRDNGIGIRERHWSTIFRLFKRLYPQTMYGGGTGAGLTIAQKIMERHGGQIWVESTYGTGATFYLVFPAI
jgi:light-regulated signal transduction histidine kinase (bacteriophytochrome)